MYRMVLKMAWASLCRRRLRSVMVVLMICSSLWGLLLMQGVYDGMTEQMIYSAIRSDSGHISIFGQGYRSDPCLAKRIPQSVFVPGKLPGLLEKNPEVRSWVQRLCQSGLAATAYYSRNIEIRGIDAQQEYGRLQDTLFRGEYGFGKDGKSAMIGFLLARKMKLDVGMKVVLSAQDVNAEVSSIALRVRGILKTNNRLLDETAVFMDIHAARKFLGVPGGVTQISILLNGEKGIVRLQHKLQAVLSDLDILSWDELYPALMQSRVIMKGFGLVVSLMIFGVTGLGIFGVVLVSVLERIREFGVMLALGTTPRRIWATILTESLLLGLAGYCMGALFGFLSLLYFKVYGLDLSLFSSAFEEFGMDAVTHAIIRPGYFSTAFAAVVVASLISATLPMQIIRKSRPIEVINTL